MVWSTNVNIFDISQEQNQANRFYFCGNRYLDFHIKDKNAVKTPSFPHQSTNKNKAKLIGSLL